MPITLAQLTSSSLVLPPLTMMAPTLDCTHFEAQIEAILTKLPLSALQGHRPMIRLKRIYNFLCSMLVYTPFTLCFDTLRGIFMHFLELTY
jgi:hypothetical protein